MNPKNKYGLSLPLSTQTSAILNAADEISRELMKEKKSL